MAAVDPCRVPTPSEAANSARRMQAPVGLTDATLIVVEMITSAIKLIADAIYNSTMINHAAAHATLSGSHEVSITAGTAKEVWHNKLKEPVVIYARAEISAAGTGTHLILSLEKETATRSKAIRSIYETTPEATVVLPPNAKLFADIDPAAAGITSNLVFSVLPLKGALGLFKAG